MVTTHLYLWLAQYPGNPIANCFFIDSLISSLWIEEPVMTFAIALSVLTTLALASVLAYLIRKVGSAGKALPVTSEWIDELSLDRYSPMLRMLDGGDIAFLR